MIIAIKKTLIYYYYYYIIIFFVIIAVLFSNWLPPWESRAAGGLTGERRFRLNSTNSGCEGVVSCCWYRSLCWAV